MKDKRTHELIGKVVSDKGEKSITVLVENYKIDKLYGKHVKMSKKYAVHDDKNEAKIGDKVRIVETRPISKTKHYRLVEILEKSIII
ncbi:MAG: 30S ribosomal protein S17 [Bacilli bacterium]|nr:30S ribosomal protein S17 [Bacilli bacterium]MDD4282519.1 30S ribosomal protein S17 [Bacilli bacterium]MDD4718280.1 30S ribosomal protein S17 [Bacilli bacterium]